MGTNVIEIEGLRKEYRRKRGRTVAIEGLDLTVPEGGVFGFLGPNGSGKTTTIRCVLGLARPTKGSVRLLGRAVPDGLAAVDASRRRDRGDAGAPPHDERPGQPRAARRRRPDREAPRHRGPRGGRAHRPRRRPREEVLPGHAPAARARGRDAQGSGAADPRRAGERARPRGDAQRARAAAPPGERGTHGARLEPPARRDPADLRPSGDPEPRPLPHARHGRRGQRGRGPRHRDAGHGRRRDRRARGVERAQAWRPSTTTVGCASRSRSSTGPGSAERSANRASGCEISGPRSAPSKTSSSRSPTTTVRTSDLAEVAS